MMIEPLDQIDLGLISLLLLEACDDTPPTALRLSSCLLAVSTDAELLAVGHEARLLLLPQQGVGAPLPLPVPPGDTVRSLAWLPRPSGTDLLLVGFASGRLSAFDPRDGFGPVWSTAPHASPLVQIHVQLAAEVSLICLFEAGIVACAPPTDEWPMSVSASSGGRSDGVGGPPLWLYTLPREAHGCHAVACGGLLPVLPLDLSAPTEGATGKDGGEGTASRRLALVAALEHELQLHLVDLPTPSSAPLGASRGLRIVARGLGALGLGSIIETTPPQEQQQQQQQQHTPSQAVRKGESTVVRALTDPPRGFLRLSIEPRRRR